MEEKTIITGVIGSDPHNIGSWVLSHALTKAGFKVINLGIAVSQEEFINAAHETNAAAILVSSLYGMAVQDCQGFRSKIIEAGLKNILLYIGGNLTLGEQEDWDATETVFKELGFDRVYPPDVELKTAIADLKKDLGLV